MQIQRHGHELAFMRLQRRTGRRLEAAFHLRDWLAVLAHDDDVQLVRSVEFLPVKLEEQRDTYAERCGKLLAPDPRNAAAKDM